MKEFLQLMRRFVSPYKKYIGWAILLNILSAVFNVFSFTFLIPILSILFKTEGADKVYHFMEWGSGDLADVAKNNFYYYISQMIVDNGPTVALIFLGLFLMVMTLFKTGCYFASSAVMIPLRTGVVRDIRIMVYAKVMRLPMSFFSEERKGVWEYLKSSWLTGRREFVIMLPRALYILPEYFPLLLGTGNYFIS